MKATKTIGLFFCFISMSFLLKAQSTLIKNAEAHFNNFAYARAIDSYEDILKKRGVSEADKILVLKNLSESYLKVKDSKNAERILRDLMKVNKDFSGSNANILLKYAQVLASNSKYKESQEIYNKYAEVASSDSNASSFSKLYTDITALSKNASCYKVDFLSINTNAAEFSPTKYQNGLVFVSNRRASNGIRKVFSWNNTPFLDLYHLDNINKLSSKPASLGGGSKPNVSKKRPESNLGDDEFTAPTANDTRTIGSYGSRNISNGYGFTDEPQTESELVRGSINSKYHEGPAVFFKDGSKVLFTRNNTKGNSARKSSDGIVKLKIYMGESNKSGWGKIVELPFNSNDYSTGHPSLSADEKTLYFASDMPGGRGGTDIYYSNFDGTNWSAPVNLGNQINTSGNEMFPHVDEKGNLYFSSDGHPGLGELDVFYTQLVDNTAKGRIINLGSPINSNKDDFGIITDGIRESGYFSSNRKNGGNDDDIYRFDRICEVKEGCELIITVFDAISKMPLNNAKLVFKDEDGNNIEHVSNAEGIIKVDITKVGFDYEFTTTRDGYAVSNVTYTSQECDNEPSRLEIAMQRPLDDVENLDPDLSKRKTCTIKGNVFANTDKSSLGNVMVYFKNMCNNTIQSTKSDNEGNFSFEAMEGCEYTLEGRLVGMASQVTTIKKFRCNKVPDLSLEMFKKGDVVKIENIYFDYGKCNLRKDAKLELDKLVKLMRQYPKMVIELGAHTDSRSSSEFNQKISEGRAKASAEYLFKRGISRSRVTHQGYGETRLVNKCADGVDCTEEEHALNRRTEFTVINME